jgi:hypothetical protein
VSAEGSENTDQTEPTDPTYSSISRRLGMASQLLVNFSQSKQTLCDSSEGRKPPVTRTFACRAGRIRTSDLLTPQVRPEHFKTAGHGIDAAKPLLRVFY